VANVSYSSQPTATTQECISSVPPSTCLQLVGESGALGEPDSPSSMDLESTMYEDLGADITSPGRCPRELMHCL
jgi:hypothetical protein